MAPLLGVTVIVGAVARRASSGRIYPWRRDRRHVPVATFGIGAGGGGAPMKDPIFLAILVAPLVLTGIPLVLRTRPSGWQR